jgi:hypothetical protein
MKQFDQEEPKWGEEEDVMVARYEKRVKEGKVKEFPINSRD